MAAPLCYATFRSSRLSGRYLPFKSIESIGYRGLVKRCFSQQKSSGFIQNHRQTLRNSAAAVSGLFCGAYIANRWSSNGESPAWGLLATQAKQRGQTWTGTQCADDPVPANIGRRPRVLSADDAKLLNLTLYQYQVCPFCCKLRAYLDYFGVPYTIQEVDPVRRKEIQFSDYKKVPILVQKSPGKEDIQLNDSSVIISILTSFMVTDEKDLSRLISYYPKLSFADDKGKALFEFTNRYNIMLQDTWGLTKAEKAEMKWRKWTDNHLVHLLPPNIYRSPSEALQAFDYISERGNFSFMQKMAIKYAGATGMFFVSMRLKKKYNIPDDVRQALYDAANEWMEVVGKKNYMGGDKPNLADLSVYGVLSSIEGLNAFNDMCEMTKIGPWYARVKQAVTTHAGAC